MQKRIINNDVFTVVGLKGSSPFSLQEHAQYPEFVLQSKNHIALKNLGSIYIADPFVYIDASGKEHLFFESLNSDGKGVIGKAERDTNKDEWKNFLFVLKESFHLSYPIITEYDGQIFMTVESAEASDVRVYMASNKNLDSWSFYKTLLRGKYYDPTPFEYNGKWFMFAASELDFSTLNLFVADDGFLGTWSPHPQNPLLTNAKGSSRPAGPVMKFRDKTCRLAQDCSERYGAAVNAYEILELTKDKYEEGEKFTLLRGTGTGWNACGMHHLQIYKVDATGLYMVSDGYENIDLDMQNV